MALVDGIRFRSQSVAAVTGRDRVPGDRCRRSVVHGCVDLGLGNPDLAPSDGIVRAVQAALSLPGAVRYGDSAGSLTLRRAYASLYARRFGVVLDPEHEVTAVLGAKEGLHHLMAVAPDGSVAVPVPSYPTHLEAPLMAGRSLRRVEVSPDDARGRAFLANLELALAGGGVGVVVASFPHNPTGVVVESGVLARAVQLARDAGALFVHDFAYWATTLDGSRAPSVLEVAHGPGVVELLSLSKSHSLAGLRAGALVGDPAVVEAVRLRKRAIDHGMAAGVEAGVIWALDHGDEELARTAETYRRRRDVVVAGLRRAGWERVVVPAGSMFVWARPHAGLDDVEVVEHLAEEHGVVLAPGREFGAAEPGWVRIALIAPEEVLEVVVAEVSACRELAQRPSARSRTKEGAGSRTSAARYSSASAKP